MHSISQVQSTCGKWSNWFFRMLPREDWNTAKDNLQSAAIKFDYDYTSLTKGLLTCQLQAKCVLTWIDDATLIQSALSSLIQASHCSTIGPGSQLASCPTQQFFGACLCLWRSGKGQSKTQGSVSFRIPIWASKWSVHQSVQNWSTCTKKTIRLKMLKAWVRCPDFHSQPQNCEIRFQSWLMELLPARFLSCPA